MKFQSYTLAAATVAVFALPAPAQVPADAFSPHSIHDEIAYLASDALKGRDTGDPGNEMAARFIAAKFAHDGLKPIGTSRERDATAQMDGSGYYQPFTFLAGHRVGKNTWLTLDYTRTDSFKDVEKRGVPIRHSEGGSIHSILYRDAALLRPSGISGEGRADGQVVFAGYGIHAPSLGHDDFAGQDLKGKVLLLIAGSPGDNPHEPLYEYGSLLRKASAAFDLGVKAILVFSPKDTEIKPERFEYQQNEDAGMPVLRIMPDVAETLFFGDAFKRLTAQADEGKMVTRALDVTAHIQADVHKITKVTANIVGLVEGSDPVLKNEVVVIGGHMDHLGLGSPYSLAKSDAPAIHYGADDNASGASGVMEMGHYFGAGSKTHVKTKRSILLICFTGEELGLYGSEFYVKHPILPLDKTVAMLNMDMVGRLRDNKLIVIGSESSPGFDEMLTDVDRSVGLTIAKSGGDFGGGSDHESFENKQIPILFFFTGTHEDYHTPTDTVDKINSEGEAKVLRLVADCAEQIADAANRPEYHKTERPSQQGGGFAVYFGSVPDYAAQVVGVQLNAVRAGSPADKAGIKAGDIIVKFGSRTIKNVYDFTYALQDHRPGDVVQVTVQRGGEKLTVTATLASRAQ